MILHSQFEKVLQVATVTLSTAMTVWTMRRKERVLFLDSFDDNHYLLFS